MSFIVNGYDTSGLGVVLTHAPEWRSIPSRNRSTVQVPGADRVLDLSGVDSASARSLDLIGTQSAANVSALITNLDALKRRLTPRVLEITLPDLPTRLFRGYLQAFSVTPIPPTFIQRGHSIAISIACNDPRGYDLTDTVVAFSSSVSMPLGTAPVSPVIRITTPNSPVITYRDYLNVTQNTLTLDTTGVTWVEIDNDRFLIYDNTGTDRSSDLVSGDFIRLDPQDGNAEGSAWPSLSVTGAAGGTATYRKAWW